MEKWLQEKVYDTAERLLSITAEEALRKVRVSEQCGGIPSMLPSLLQRTIMIESEFRQFHRDRTTPALNWDVFGLENKATVMAQPLRSVCDILKPSVQRPTSSRRRMIPFKGHGQASGLDRPAGLLLSHAAREFRRHRQLVVELHT